MSVSRFQDESKQLSDFYTEVLVLCPSCQSKANAKLNKEAKKAELICVNCGYNQSKKTETNIAGVNANIEMAAHEYFGAELWLKAPFKNNFFFAYNYAHLDYLERFIAAHIREHKNRTGFTLLEKLPKFYNN